MKGTTSLRTQLGAGSRILALAAVALGLPFAAQATTNVYLVTLTTDLVNTPSNCGVTPPSLYNGCSGATGFKWTDTIAAGSTITAVKVEFNNGVDCHGTGTVLSTTLNGTASGTVASVNFCNCSPRTQIYVLNPAVAPYVRGGTNTFLVTNPTTCYGFNQNAGLANAFARITVDFTGGSTGGTDPWVTALPGSYSTGQAGKIVGTNLDAAISTRATATAVAAVQTTDTAIQGTVNTINTNLNAAKAKIDLNLDATTSSRSTQASLDVLKKDVDDSFANLHDASVKQAVEAQVMDNAFKKTGLNPTYVIPKSLGGQLETVRKIVGDASALAAAGGYDQTLTNADLAQGDAAYANSDWLGAYNWFVEGYLDIFGIKHH